MSQAVVVALGVAADGQRKFLGFDVGFDVGEAFWTEFLRSLKVRGLGGSPQSSAPRSRNPTPITLTRNSTRS